MKEYKETTNFDKTKEKLKSPQAINVNTVKYDANGGENAPKEQTKTKGKELVLSTIVPTKEGYKFVTVSELIGEN